MADHDGSRQASPWTTDAVTALADIDSSTRGLDPADAEERLKRFGANRLQEKPRRPVWMKFFDQFKNFLVLVLIGAAALAGAIGDIKDAVVILIVIVLNAGLGLYQEHRAEATLAALKQMLPRHARVRRGGEVWQIDADELVPGDISSPVISKRRRCSPGSRRSTR